MTRIAVTAASGHLGAEIARAAVDLVGAANVVGLARRPARAESLGIEIRPGDYAAQNDLVDSLKGVDCVLLVSGMAAPDERIGQHRNVIQAAKTAGVRKVVYTSIQGAEENTAFSPSFKVIGKRRRTFVPVASLG